MDFSFSQIVNNVQVPYSEQIHGFTDHVLVQLTNIHSLLDTTISPIFYLHGFPSVIELQRCAKKCSKNQTVFTIRMLRPLDFIISAVINENTTILVDQKKSVEFKIRNGQFQLTCKRTKSAGDDSVVFKVHVQSNAPVAMIHRPEYTLNKIPLNREFTDLNDTVGWFLNEHLSDISFKCINRKTNTTVKLPAHRMVLSSVSPSMRTLLQQSLKSGIVDIDFTDYSSESVHSLLRLLYTGQLMIDADHLSETLLILYNYCNDSFTWTTVVEKLANLVCSSTVLPIYEFMSTRAFESVNLMQLRDYCLSFIDSNADFILTEETFIGIQRSTLCEILQRDTLITREIRLFNALNEWAKNQCVIKCIEVSPGNKLKFIGDSIKYIRFSAMTAQEFACGPSLSGLITNKETIRFLMQVTNFQSEQMSDIHMIGKRRNQQSGWSNGCSLEFLSSVGDDQQIDKIPSAPPTYQLNQFDCDCDENIETKLNLMYSALAD